MTRQEAIEIATKRTGQADPVRFIDLCAELGMLKLDEPKSAMTRALQALVNEIRNPDVFRQVLDEAGLKIVEK